jgi:SAM-dependent methyltransferase
MGFFTLDLARMVGPRGRVVAVDLQPRMLAGLKRRAGKAGLLERIEIRQAGGDSLNVADLAGSVDVALLLLVLHEVPDPGRFLAEIRETLKPGGRLLLVEPRGHVTVADFDASLALARKVGFLLVDRPRLGRDLAALLEASADSPVEGGPEVR